MNEQGSLRRTIGLFGAISVGVGAIVGGGILALAGVAFATTGPSAIIAFALNGLIAMFTCLTFSEISSTFPESGGPYMFSRKILSIHAAFLVGWIVWFASILAAVLYAVGFASFGVVFLHKLWSVTLDAPPAWLTSKWANTFLAIIATIAYSIKLSYKPGGSDKIINVTKVLVFLVLIVGGIWILITDPSIKIEEKLSPFLTRGFLGLLQAMGFTFIALQGFDLISSVGGEIQKPQRNIPRAMILSLLIAISIYIPLLFVMATVGVGKEESVSVLATKYSEIMLAIGARNYLGNFGYWLVVVAAILSMLSALSANILASSRVAFAMARDRVLIRSLGKINPRFGTPLNSTFTTAAIIIMLMFLLTDVASAGAAASLIFLISFSLVNYLGILLRKRTRSELIPFKTPLFPLVPILGIVSSISLALFQGVMVPIAGIIIMIWLTVGVFLYFARFSKPARLFDAFSEASDPQLLQLRGVSPLVLVPIANPTHAASMVAMGHSLIPPPYGRVLLLSVVPPPKKWDKKDYPPQLINSTRVLKEALSASFAEGFPTEALITVASDVWKEIRRVSRDYRSFAMVLGFTSLAKDTAVSNLEKLIDSVDCDVLILKAPPGWKIREVKKVLIPVGGKGKHGELLARLIGSLYRIGKPEITFLKVMPENTSWKERGKAREDLFFLAENLLTKGNFTVKIVLNNDVAEEIIKHSMDTDLLILGIRKIGKHKTFSELSLKIARDTLCPLLFINHHS